MLTAKYIHLGLLLLKKILTISLLILIFLGQVGYHFIAGAIREMHKERMISAILPYLKDEQLVKIDPLDKGIYWMEEDKEFVYNGSMYDVVKVVTKAGKTSLLCLSDKQEDQISHFCNKVTTQNTSQSGDHKSTKQISFVPEYISTALPVTENFPANPVKNVFGEQVQCRQIVVCIDIQAPPPRV